MVVVGGFQAGTAAPFEGIAQGVYLQPGKCCPRTLVGLGHGTRIQREGQAIHGDGGADGAGVEVAVPDAREARGGHPLFGLHLLLLGHAEVALQQQPGVFGWIGVERLDELLPCKFELLGTQVGTPQLGLVDRPVVLGHQLGQDGDGLPIVFAFDQAVGGVVAAFVVLGLELSGGAAVLGADPGAGQGQQGAQQLASEPTGVALGGWMHK